LGGSSYYCSCPSNTYGPNCEFIDFCLTCSGSTCSQPCQNGGTCRSFQNGVFKCICLPGYVGDTCQNFNG
jgi:hypothetical protein